MLTLTACNLFFPKVEFAAWVTDNVDSSKRLDPSERENNSAQSLSLQHLQGVFYIMGIAWLLGGVVLMLELLWVYTLQ